MCSRRKKDAEPKRPPPYMVALYDFDPFTPSDVIHQHPSYTAPDVSNQLAFKRGDRLQVLSEELDWWMPCKQATSDDQGYVPSSLFAPVCVVSTENNGTNFHQISETEDTELIDTDLIPCIEGQYVDMSYFPNALGATKAQKKTSPRETANIFSRITFWWMTGLMIKGFKKPLVDTDLWSLSHDNQAIKLTASLHKQWKKQIDKLPSTEVFGNEQSESSSEDSGIDEQDKTTTQNEPHTQEKHDDENTPSAANDIPKSPGSSESPSNGTPNGSPSRVPFVEIKDKKEEKKTKTNVPSLWYTLFRCFGPLFMFGAFFKLIHDGLLFVNPYILRLFIQYIEGKGPQESWRGYVYALCFFAVGTGQSLCLQHYFDKAVTTGMRARSAFMGIVYRKMLLLSNKGKTKFSSGDMVNLMSVDATKFQDITTYMNMVWSAPLQIILSVTFLHNLLGWSIFAGVGIMSLLLPFNYCVSKKIRASQMKLMHEKDLRIKGMNDIFGGIKVLKLYAWEESFLKKITGLRGKELKQLRSFMLWKAFTSFAFGCTPFLVSLATFAVYVLVGNELTSEKAFVAISLFNLIQFPMTILPEIITRLIQCQVSIKRLSDFLLAEELDENNVTQTADNKDPVAVSVKHGRFTWDDQYSFVLKHINLDVERGSLVAIVGHVGCGKSSLLSALLGEMEKRNGTVTVNGSVAYVPQQAWIQNTSLENNVLCGRSYHSDKYNRIIDACALRSDLDILPAGDLTEIGEKGINLSGGQKQRVSLARALYCGADIFFFDDPLSAVDSHVGKHIFDNVIGPNSILAKKVRVLVTHNLNFLPQVDKVIVMKDGGISEVGTYEELISRNGAYAELLRTFVNDEEDEELVDEQSGTDVVRTNRSESLASIRSNQYSAVEKILHAKAQMEKRNAELKQKAAMIKEETSETGRVHLAVFYAYLKSMGLFVSFCVILFVAGSKFFLVGARIWLADWSSRNSTSTAERDHYLMVYGLLGLGHCVSTYLSSVSMIVGAFIASRFLHDKLLLNILHLPMSFFEVTPMGRLTNRFSKDVNVVDDDIPATLLSFYGCFFGVISVMFTISYSTPLFLIALVPLAVIYVLTQRFYVASSRQLKRIESVKRSPIYNHFFESINGVTVIRAHKLQLEFTEENENRIDDNQAAYLPNMMANRWLAVRLEFIGNCIIFFAALFAIVSKDSISSGLAGLSISYAMQITQTLNWMIRMTSKLETDVIAVERILEYSEVQREANWINYDNRPPEAWPTDGAVEIKDYCVRYRSDLDYALQHISFDIITAEKIGVVGRTGAGKSTIAMAMFRMLEASEGAIKIDGVDIADIGLQDLRSKLTIIPQDPVLFSGSIRFNLDPFNSYPDDAVWNALEISHLKTFVSSLPEKLEQPVAEGGENFSIGQRQLICLARALLRKTKVLVLDEATAAIDMETDELIQKTIRDEFNCCTILTIAHRLNTVMDYDRILVLDKGKILEFDTPQKLLLAKGSFYDMAKDANLI